MQCPWHSCGSFIDSVSSGFLQAPPAVMSPLYKEVDAGWGVRGQAQKPQEKAERASVERGVPGNGCADAAPGPREKQSVRNPLVAHMRKLN